MTPVNTLLTLFVSCMLITSSFAQDMMQDETRGEQIKERVMQLKKAKLLDMLDLSSDVADKFLVQYNAGQKKIDAAKKALDDAIKDLNQTVKNKGSQSDITNKTEIVLKYYDVWLSAARERITMLKPLLNAEQYAKLMMFEIKFPEVLQKLIMMRNKKAEMFGR
ncbi:MAG: hypothetical protein U0Y96_11755 [Candidatus Kapaibacterium sp.]|nr:hypothetical protein [Bacteroidota bacterium]